MRKVLFALAMIAASCPAFAQFMQIQSTGLLDSSGTPLNGVISFAPVNAQGVPLSYRLPYAGQALSNVVQCNVVNGAITTKIGGNPCQLADVSKTNPVNVCFAVTAVDNTTGNSVLGPGYGCIQPSSNAAVGGAGYGWCSATVCNFDLYVPSTPGRTVTTAGPMGLQGPVGTGSVVTANGAQGNFAISNNLTAGSIQGVLTVDSQPGTELGAQINAADAKLGVSAGVMAIFAPATITTTPTISSNHTVFLYGPITINNVGILMGNHVAWRCVGPGASITVLGNIPGLFNQHGVSDFKIEGCTVHGSLTNVGNYLIDVNGTVSGTQVLGNQVDSMGLVTSLNATNLDNLKVIGNTDTYATGGSGNASGVYGFWVTHAVIQGNTFISTLNGAQWWGGDAAVSGLSTGLAANWTATGNHCIGVGACIWGSMGTDMTVTGNTDLGCGDVCFDEEGGVRNSFTANHANQCTNGCFASFYGGLDNIFDGNTAEATGSTGFLLRNASEIPQAVTGLRVEGNTFTCSTLCDAALIDPAYDFYFENNSIRNGVFGSTKYGGGQVSISRNGWDFSVTTAAPVITVPQMLNGGTAIVDDNTIMSSVTQPSNAVAISAITGDYNSADWYFFRRNTINEFPTGISTTAAGGNAGVPVYWSLEKNTIGSATIAHSFLNPTTNTYPYENYRVTADNKDFFGNTILGVNIGQVLQGQSGTTAAAIGATTTAVLSYTATPNGIAPAWVCGVTATTGSPSIVNYTNTAKNQITVTLQATTAVAAAGVALCQEVGY